MPASSLGTDEQVLLYAPTWKGDFYTPEADVEQLREHCPVDDARDDHRRYRVLLKVHQRLYQLARADSRLSPRCLVPNEIPSNDVLAVTDVLVTDYSSIFVDFLATGRPVLFFAPDLDDYTASRGLYLPPEEWPGPACRTVDELVAAVGRSGTGRADDPLVAYADAYRTAQNRYCPREDGGATERVIDVVFRGVTPGYDLRRDDDSRQRTSVLLNLGGLRRNGITSAALSLLDNIDHTGSTCRSVSRATAHPEQRRSSSRSIPRSACFRSRWTSSAAGSASNCCSAGQPHVPAVGRSCSERGDRSLADEWTRSFGSSRFDHVIDFSGYSPYWIKLLANRTAGSFPSGCTTTSAPNCPTARGQPRCGLGPEGRVQPLPAPPTSSCPCPNPLNEVNRQALAELAPGVRFTFARNTINYQRIRRLADEPARNPSKGAKHVFVTAGRLSPEKNHARLISAFATVYADQPDTRLLRPRLRAVARRLKCWSTSCRSATL